MPSAAFAPALGRTLAASQRRNEGGCLHLRSIRVIFQKSKSPHQAAKHGQCGAPFGFFYLELFLLSCFSSNLLSLHDLLGCGIPDCYGLVEVREVSQVAADGRIVAEDLVFDDGFPSAHGVVEISLVVDGVAVSRRRGVRLAFGVDLRGQRGRLGMIFVPLLQVRVAQSFRPTENGVAFGLGTRVLGR